MTVRAFLRRLKGPNSNQLSCLSTDMTTEELIAEEHEM